MPRQSAAALAVLSADTGHSSLRPSEAAPKEVIELFDEILGSVSHQHFRQGDSYMLELLCQSILMSRRAYAELKKNGPVVNGKRNPWQDILMSSHKSAANLSSKLRLVPSARAADRSSGPGMSYYDVKKQRHAKPWSNEE